MSQWVAYIVQFVWQRNCFGLPSTVRKRGIENGYTDNENEKLVNDNQDSFWIYQIVNHYDWSISY